MDDGVNRGTHHQAGNNLRVGEVPLDYLDSPHGVAMSAAEIIDDHDRVTRIGKVPGHHAAHVSRPAGYQNSHGLSS